MAGSAVEQVGTVITDQFEQHAQKFDLSAQELRALIQAVHRSAEAIDRARATLAEDRQLQAQGLDFIAFGSLARYEMTASSDLDYLLVGKSPQDRNQADAICKEAVDELRRYMIDGVTISEPGASGLFGTIIDRDDITRHIGLEADTNLTLSRRILFLEESVSLYDTEAHQALLQVILKRYLASRKLGSERIPRVLLNDILRYWRTVAVDYHAKSSPEAPYSLRYLKLLIPRKLCFISSVAPLFLMSSGLEDMDELNFLQEAFSQPSIVRLARLFASVSHRSFSDSDDMRASAQNVFRILNEFIEHSGQSEWREAIANECRQPDASNGENFGHMRALGRELHTEIGKIFTSEAMLPFTKEYMIS